MAEAAEGDLGVRRWPTKAEAHRTRDERYGSWMLC